ncbi:MAG: polysaccharide biosynthesis protein [Clostridia bacterium]|nr:polysaccharide biosynthesis protein [Clostridia bacterium]
MKESSNNTAKKSAVNMFFSGVVILTVANIMVKAVGLISKIALNRVVGSIGAGYYSSAYEIYAFLYIISTSGLPVALSIMVSRSRARGRFKEAKKIYNVAIVLFLIIGGIFAALMLLLSSNIACAISASETTLCIIAIAPTILFVCISSCLRGFFQGYQMMHPTAISQFIEACCKVLVGVGFAFWARAQGYEDHIVAAFTILGVTVGVFLGMVFLYVRKLFFKDKFINEAYLQELQSKNGYCVLQDDSCKSGKELLKELLKIAIPVTISSAVLSLTVIIDTFMVQGRLLAYGMEENLVKVCYGDYTSLVISMCNLPTVLFYPIANALVPLISASNEAKNYEASAKMRSFSLRVINLIAIPCALGLGIFSYPILDLLMFKADSVERAAPWLSVAAISVVFLGLISATNAFLNTAGKQKLPIISMLVGAGAKLIANYFLIGAFGIYGAPIATVICYLFASSLNIFFTVKYVGELPEIKKVFGMPVICGVISIGISALIYLGLAMIIPGKLATIVCIILAVLGYLMMILKTKTVVKNEILMLPKGEKLVFLLEKFKLISKNG